MRIVENYWMKNKQWLLPRDEDGVCSPKDDAPADVKASFRLYLKQMSKLSKQFEKDGIHRL